MTGFDIAVIAVILVSGVFAYWRGFVREALSIAAWVFAAAAAYYAFPYALPLAERFLPKGTTADIATGAGGFLIALIVFHILAKAIANRVKHSTLSPIDRALGLIFGLARGVILVCVAYIALAWFMPAGEKRPAWLAESRTLPFLEAGAEKLESYFTKGAPSKTSARSTVEREAERAIGAFTKPAAPSPPASAAPAYSSGEQRELNRLIEMQNSQ